MIEPTVTVINESNNTYLICVHLSSESSSVLKSKTYSVYAPNEAIAIDRAIQLFKNSR